MEQSLQETAAASSPPKKKRGRPKKAEKVLLLPSNEASTVAKDVPKVRRRKRKGFSKSVSVSGKKKRQQQGTSSSAKILQSDGVSAPGPMAEKEESAPNVKVGQSVHGVVDGTFDAGYLVTVRVGDMETMFRGVVFGPGLSLPLSRDNDVAPKMKRMNHDDTPEIGASSASLNEGAPVPTPSVPVLPHAPVSASIPVSSPLLPANEAHRVAAMPGSAGMGFRAPIPPSGTGGYSPATYRSPSFGQSPMQNASGGFYYAPPPTHTPSPNSNHSHGGYYPPRGFSYPFQFPRAEYGGPPQFAGPSPSAAPSQNLQGGFPPHGST
eukprot:c15447_g1_i1 orf=441-1406(+)